MDKIKPLFAATATAVGGRNGHSESSDSIVAVDLSVPKEMGGPGKPGPLTVPAEQLRSVLGIASVEVRTGDKPLAITDTPLAG